jgi:hypothetical protein
MEFSEIVMWLGFFLAAFSVVGNDVIQTLGTFLTSNEQRVSWYVLWLYAACILGFALFAGHQAGDISYGRLEKFQAGLQTLQYEWYYLLPPVVLLIITRMGSPVSTTFMILTLFSLSNVPDDVSVMVSSIFDSSTKLGGMIEKSLLGYAVAFVAAVGIYMVISRLTERFFISNEVKPQNMWWWTVLQWLTTGFLWYQWLTQDLANIYVYLRGGNTLSTGQFLISVLILLGLLALIFYSRGGAVQEVVRRKTNTVDIRSATFIDFIYGIVLYIFKYDNFMGMTYQFPWTGNLPMSTTWVFVGLLAGRELAIRWRLEQKITPKVWKDVTGDLGKVMLGLAVSVVLVFAIKLLS